MMLKKYFTKGVAMLLALSVFSGSISARAAQREPIDWWSTEREELKNMELSDFPEFDGWSTELLAIGDYEGYCSEDGKSFWLSGIDLSLDDDLSPDALKKVEIPEKIDGMTVTRVSPFSPDSAEPNLFLECHRKRELNSDNFSQLCGQYVEELILPDSVTEIGQKTFQYMPALKKVVLPAGLKEMGSLVFSGDNSLEEISLSASVSDLKVDTFQGADNLKSISIDSKNTVFSARENGIYSADGKTLYIVYGSKKNTFVIDSKVEYIKDVQKKSRTNYVGPLLRGYKVSVDGKNKTYGFKSGCVYLKKTGELLYCTNNNKNLKLPACIKKLTQKSCFINPYMNSITLSKNMKTLDGLCICAEESFLKKIIFTSAKPVKIKHADFLDRYNPMTLVVPKKQVKQYKKQVEGYRQIVVKGAYVRAAEKKSGKYRYEVLNKKKKTAAITHVNNAGATVKIPKRIDGYTVVYVGTVEKADTTIFSEQDAKKIKQIKLPDTLRKIGNRAFVGCEKLKKIVLPKNLNYIGKSTFSGCYNLEKVVFKTNKAKIGKNAFFTGSTLLSSDKRSHLQKVEFPATYKGKIADSAFSGFIGTTFNWVNFTAENGAFLRSVTTLKKIKVHPKVNKVDIPRNCLDGCAGQVEISVPKNVESVHIWQQRYNIKQITIYGMDTTLKGDYFMGKYHDEIMISVETVKCKKKSAAWKMVSQYICPDFTNVDWENFHEESTDYNEDNIEFKQVELVKL